VFNIGGIGETSILNLANTIREQLKSESVINFMNYEDVYPIGYEDMQRRVPDISKINKHNGWEPNLNLKDIIDDVTKSLTSTA
jgi:UDP-glucose 4-epimerase